MAKNGRKHTKAQTRGRALQVVGDLQRAKKGHESLSLKKASSLRGISPGAVLKHYRSAFRKKGKSYQVKTSDRFKITVFLPSSRGEIRVSTTGKKERLKAGAWLSALNAAKTGDFSKMNRLSKKGVRIGGKRLPTNRKQVKRILKALETKNGRSFESLYVGFTTTP
jgi:hypothetical protein